MRRVSGRPRLPHADRSRESVVQSVRAHLGAVVRRARCSADASSSSYVNPSAAKLADWSDSMTHRIQQFLADGRPQTPCPVVDLSVIEENDRPLTDALPLARVYYAVKANPAPEIIGCLARLGSHFDVA